MRLTITLGLVVWFLFSCSIEKKNISIQYLDTKYLLEKAIIQLTAQHKTLHKTLVFGDSSYTQNLKSVDWSKELQPFVEIDLQKNAYKGRFKVNTTLVDKNLIVFNYKALDDKTDLQELRITLNQLDSTLVYLKAKYSEQNTLYTASKELTLGIDSSFSISGSQQVQFGNVVHYLIKGTFNEGQ